LLPGNRRDRFGAGDLVERVLTATGARDQTAVDQVFEHGRDVLRVVALERFDQLPAAQPRARAQLLQHGLPERVLALASAAREPADLQLIAAQREPEHVGGDLATYALRLELTRQVEEDLIGHARERRANTGGGR
jgi:hypothetical protein